jgi:hypothetical protein
LSSGVVEAFDGEAAAVATAHDPVVAVGDLPVVEVSVGGVVESRDNAVADAGDVPVVQVDTVGGDLAHRDEVGSGAGG